MNLKALVEKRNLLVGKMEEMLKAIETETRAFNEEETKTFADCQKEIADIDATMKLSEEARNLEQMTIEEKKAVDMKEVELRAFNEMIRHDVMAYHEERADVNFTKGDNGAIVPKTIANKIIETVKQLAPIYAMATKYTVKGDLVFPVYDETTKVTCAYATEFTELEATGGKFTSVTLGGFVAGALAKVSMSLVNNAQFDLVNYVILKVAESVASFLEKELIVGTASKMTGLLSSTKSFTTASATALTSDDLIKAQLVVPQQLQAGACWIMNTKTLGVLRTLKDDNGRYLLQDNIVDGFGFSLLGKPVYLSDNMPDIATKVAPIVYGDMSGLYVKVVEDVQIQVLREKYATEHAVGVVAWIEADSKIVEPQKIVTVKMA